MSSSKVFVRVQRVNVEWTHCVSFLPCFHSRVVLCFSSCLALLLLTGPSSHAVKFYGIFYP